MKTLYQALTESGINCSNWQSDLYFPVTNETRQILSQYPDQAKSTFKSNIDNALMYECAFAFDPYWNNK